MNFLKFIGIICDMLFRLVLATMILRIIDPNPPTHILLIVVTLALLSALSHIPKEE